MGMHGGRSVGRSVLLQPLPTRQICCAGDALVGASVALFSNPSAHRTNSIRPTSCRRPSGSR